MTDEELCDDNRVGGLEFLYRGDAAFTYNLDDEPGHHPVNSLPSSYRTVKFYEIGPTSVSASIQLLLFTIFTYILIHRSRVNTSILSYILSR